ncbi:MAG: DAK2 domain-containing protein [Anaerolineae bacterium]|nr:DAK2 domain-containing protein [Anaerolineae bacterium]
MAAFTFHNLPTADDHGLLTDKYPPGSPVLSLDGEDFRALFRAGCAWLERDHQTVNALNVFPVPDGDTGTNMLLTMQSALEEIGGLQSNHAGDVIKAAAHGALMGARGNSGVILSQIFRGLARRLEGETLVDAAELVAAFQAGSETAYRGVVRPVEGTILTVIREVAEALPVKATDNDLRALFGHIVRVAASAVERTPTLLPVLAEAGVVDAGGQGLFLILEGMHRCLQGLEVFVTPTAAVEMIEHAEVLVGEYGYDVQCVVLGMGLDVEQMRHDIAQMGDSVLVVGDSRTVKVHVHTDRPGTPLNYCAALGQLDRVIVENMQMQYERFVGEGGPRMEGAVAAPAPVPPAARVSVPLGPIGTVAVTVGEGLESVFRSLGVQAIVPGGQTMNPSTEDLLKAIEQVATDEVIVLPNNKNVILAAQQAQQLSSKKVRVVPSKSIPQGISALLALNQQADLETNVQMMEAALSSVQTGEVTVAVRDVNLGHIRVAAGDFIGLRDDELTARGDNPEAVVFALLEQMAAEDAEIVTLYRGEPASTAEAEALVAALRDRYPEQEIELVDGGQPYYHYILSVE